MVTLCNLAIGVLAVIMALENQVLFASWLILLAGVLDFLDGFKVKRGTKARAHDPTSDGLLLHDCFSPREV